MPEKEVFIRGSIKGLHVFAAVHSWGIPNLVLSACGGKIQTWGKKGLKKRNAKIQQSVPSCVSTVEVLNLSEMLIFLLLTHLHLCWVQYDICFLLSIALLLFLGAGAFHMCRVGGGEWVMGTEGCNTERTWNFACCPKWLVKNSTANLYLPHVPFPKTGCGAGIWIKQLYLHKPLLPGSERCCSVPWLPGSCWGRQSSGAVAGSHFLPVPWLLCCCR